ncbi:MAG: phosphoribosyltransferase [Candidatus Bathyarchaeota archaeon]|nr:MAG: phosphoribosyltransferase [Candidatus Bathyarchaeota archaeon]
MEEEKYHLQNHNLTLEFDIPSWEQIYTLLLNLSDQIKRARFRPDVIVGVSRGGWPPARILSDLLENPELANVKTEFYLDVAKTKSEPVITQPVSVTVQGKRVLIVDDIADTGSSLRLVRSHLKEQSAADVKIATIYYKPWSVVKPDWYERETKDWVIFPWERKETVKNVVRRFADEGKTVEEAKETLIHHGLDRKLAEKFLKEILEGQA